MRRLTSLALLILTLSVIGCFPVELSVTRQGEVVVPRAEGVVLFNPATGASRFVAPGAPREAQEFAVASPDGMRILRAVTEWDEKGDAGSSARVILTDLASGTNTELASIDNATFLQWDPRDRFVSWSFMSSDQQEGVTENLPELHIYNLATRVDSRVAVNVSVTHRWLADGSAIVFLKTETKDTDGRVGALCVYDVATGKTRRVAVVRGAEWFDVTADGAEVVLSAQGMIGIDGRRRSRGDDKALYVINVKEGTFRRLEFNADHARYSPDGQRVAILKDRVLRVCDREFELPDGSLTRCVAELDNSAKYHVAWYSNDEVLVVQKHAVFGTVANAPELRLVNVVTGAVRDLQPDLDRIARAGITPQVP